MALIDEATSNGPASQNKPGSLSTFVNNPPDLTPAQRKLGQHLMVYEGSVWSVMNAIAGSGSILLTAFALYLQADAFFLGLVSSLPLLASLIQLWTPQIVAAGGSRKRVCLLTLGVARLLLTPLVFVAVGAWIWPNLNWLWLLTLLLFLTLSAALTAIGGTSWLSWASTVVPLELRNNYFARRNTILGAIGLITTFLAGTFLDWWKVGEGTSKQTHPAAYIILVGVAALAGLATLPLLSSTPDLVQPSEAARPRIRLRDSLKATWSHLPLRKFLLFRSFWMFAVALVVPYYSVYMLKNLHLSFTEVSILTNVGALASLLSTPVWGTVINKFGCSRVLFWTSLCKVFYIILWAFVVPGSPFIPLLLLHASVAIDGGLGLAAGNLLMNLMPSQDSKNVTHFSVFSATTNVASAAGPFLAGTLIGVIAATQFEFAGILVGGIQVVFFISGGLRLLSLLLFRGFDDSAAAK